MALTCHVLMYFKLSFNVLLLKAAYNSAYKSKTLSPEVLLVTISLPTY